MRASGAQSTGSPAYRVAVDAAPAQRPQSAAEITPAQAVQHEVHGEIAVVHQGSYFLGSHQPVRGCVVLLVKWAWLEIKRCVN